MEKVTQVLTSGVLGQGQELILMSNPPFMANEKRKVEYFNVAINSPSAFFNTRYSTVTATTVQVYVLTFAASEAFPKS